MSWLGLDIGGANLKIADGNGFANSVPFPLWRQPERLSSALAELLARSPRVESMAVTMTGELADCFATKAEGVDAICDAMEEAANDRIVRIYLCDGRLVDAKTARAAPLLAAASNWHVLATFAARYLVGKAGLLIDIGSTTCDIIPFGRSGPCTIGKTDPKRLATGELVYTGIQRSPVCAVVSELPWRDGTCPVAQEVFATTQDAYVLLDQLAEEPNNLDTADGRPLTKAHAHARLARAICADTTMVSMDDAIRSAVAIRGTQLELLTVAVKKALEVSIEPPTTVVLSGHGEFLTRMLLERLEHSAEVISITGELGSEVSRAACAHALAVIARERSEV